MRKRCVCCGKLTHNWEKVNGSPTHCFDGCYSTTGRDNRTIDGKPAWLAVDGELPWAKKRMWANYLTAAR
jgi:hypothetical protein